MIEYLGEIETKYENTLACLSGAQMGSNYEKLKVENLVTYSLLKASSGLCLLTKAKTVMTLVQ